MSKLLRKGMYLVMALVLVTMTLVTGCAKKQTDSEDVKESYEIGFSQHWGTTCYPRVIMKGAEDAKAEWEEKLGIEINISSTDSGMEDPSKQANDIQDLYAQKMDGLMVFSGDAKVTGQAVKITFNKSNIPVVVTDTGMEGAEFVSHVTTDNYHAGEIGAEALQEYLEEGDKVIAFNSSPGIASVQDRVKGFMDKVEAFGFEQLPEKTCKVSVEEGKKLMEDILVSEPSIGAVFTTTVETAIGAASALKNAGNTTCKIVAFDLNEVALKMVKDDELFAVVVQDPYFIGYNGMYQMMYELTGQKDKIEKYMGSPAYVLTKENAAEFEDNPQITLK